MAASNRNVAARGRIGRKKRSALSDAGGGRLRDEERFRGLLCVVETCTRQAQRTLHSANVFRPNLWDRQTTISMGRNPLATSRVHSLVRGVVPLVVVHLCGWREMQAESRRLEEVPATPGRNVDERDAVLPQHLPDVSQSELRFPKVLEDVVADHRVEAGGWHLLEHFGQLALDGRDGRLRLQIGRNRQVDQRRRGDLLKHGAHEIGVVAAPEVADGLALEAVKDAADASHRQPLTEAIEGRGFVILAERPRAMAVAAHWARA